MTEDTDTYTEAEQEEEHEGQEHPESQQQASQQQQEEPNTPKQAWDLALAQMTQEEAIDYQQRTAQALAAGFPIPPPPGYDEPAPARVDAQARAEQEAQTAKDLESRTAEAERTGDWNASAALKGQLMNLARQQSNSEQTTYGWRGPAA